jgi:hypothetical protein
MPSFDPKTLQPWWQNLTPPGPPYPELVLAQRESFYVLVSKLDPVECRAYSVLLRRRKAPMMPGMSEEEIGEVKDELKQFSSSFRRQS